MNDRRLEELVGMRTTEDTRVQRPLQFAGNSYSKSIKVEDLGPEMRENYVFEERGRLARGFGSVNRRY